MHKEVEKIEGYNIFVSEKTMQDYTVGAAKIPHCRLN